MPRKKTAPDEAPTKGLKRVTLAAEYTDPETDKVHDADSTIALPRHVANQLLNDGLARLPQDEAAPEGEDNSGTPPNTDNPNGSVS